MCILKHFKAFLYICRFFKNNPPLSTLRFPGLKARACLWPELRPRAQGWPPEVRFFIPSLKTRLGAVEWVKLFWNLSLLLIPIFLEVPSNFRRNLTIRHPVNCFNTDDASTHFVFHETFLQLALGLTRTKDQNGFCITNTRNDRIVVNVEIVP